MQTIAVLLGIDADVQDTEGVYYRVFSNLKLLKRLYHAIVINVCP